MKLSETQILYKPASPCLEIPGEILLAPYPSGGWRTANSTASFPDPQHMTPEEQTSWLFNLVVHLIIRDRLDPQLVHETLCGIREYRDGFGEGMPVWVFSRGELGAELDGGSDDRPF